MQNNAKNYDREFTSFCSKIKADGQTPKLLLHVCCAPCATYCLTRVVEFFDVTLFYSNDNISGLEEWDKRLSQVKRLTETVNGGNFAIHALLPLKLEIKPYEHNRFQEIAASLENEKEGGARCAKCFRMRLTDTSVFASENGFDFFATTLSVSPYKNSVLLNKIGFETAAKAAYLPSDFKKNGGYVKSVSLSEEYGLYRQHYCGCAFSEKPILSE